MAGILCGVPCLWRVCYREMKDKSGTPVGMSYEFLAVVIE